MKKVLLLLAALAATLPALPQTAREEILADRHRSASNYYAYPEPTTPQTPPPAGYKPVYLSHYARHGSRWLIGRGEYTNPRNTLRKANAQGKLSADGRRALSVLDSMASLAKGRLGELTAKGARQHRGIAERMYQNYKPIFKKNAPVDARSTVVIRCILSMMNECLQLQEHVPSLNITSDASQADMYYMNDERNAAVGKHYNGTRADSVRRVFYARNVHPQAFARRLFNDEAYARDSVNAGALMSQIFSVASNMQSHDLDLDLYFLFTDEELYQQWRYQNVSWYLSLGPSAINGGMMPYYERNLLQNILTTADSCLALENPGATLRFGHEVVVLPLACLMELDSCGRQYEDPETLEQHWRNYKIFPMASNVQLVFYRKRGSDDVLVKALLNEREASLPVASDLKPYYHWQDVRAYYQRKIDAFR